MALGITVDFNANLIKLNSQVDKAFERFDKFQSKAESMSVGINKAFGALGAGLSAGAFVGFVKSGIDAADALNDMADRTGIAVEKLAGFKLAAKLADTDLESFAQGVNKLSVNIAKNADDFAKLGVTAKDPAEAFLQFADIFKSIEDQQTKAAVGSTALGKSWAELAPLLNQGSEELRKQIDLGQKQSGITAEQAKQAAEFNEKLDTLTQRFNSLSIVLTGPALDGLLAVGNAIKFANEQSQGFDPLAWLGAAQGGGSKASQLFYINKQIDELTAKANEMRNGGFFSALFGDLEAVDEQIIRLKKDKEALIVQQTPTSQPTTSPPPTIPQFFLGGSDGADKAAAQADKLANAEKARLQAIKDIVDGLNQDIAVEGLSNDEKARALELSTALKKAQGDEVGIITNLVNKKYDDIEASKRQAAQWSQLVEDRNKLFDLNKEVDFFAKSNETSPESFNTLIAKIRDVGKETDATDAEIKALLDKAGTAFNENYSAKLDAMSEYAISAARNMQSAFADFLFDPFAKGADGMVSAFANTVKRMAAEAASAQIMEGLFGKQSDKGGFSLGGLAGAAWSGISSLFADGGIMTSAGPIPLNRYATGGIANGPQLALFGEGRMNEAYVPLPDGKSIPVTMSGKASGQVNNVVIQVQGGNSPEDTGRRVGEAFIRTIARDEINSAARIGNKLNPTTRF